MRCLSIHLTDLCNSKCSFCVVGSPLYTKDSVSYEQVLTFLRENAKSGYNVVNLHGGEATIHPHFLELLEVIKLLGYSEVHVQTNGISLANLEFANRTIRGGVRLFIVSLHGDTPMVHDSQTGSPGGLERTLTGIRNVKALGARVRTNTVITHQNVTRLSEITDLAVSLGVDHINYSNLHPVGSAIFGLSRIAPMFAVVREYLLPSIERALSCGRRVTLEGFPWCTLPEHLNLRLSNEFRAIRMLYRGKVIENYDRFMNEEMRTYGPPCVECAKREECGGVYRQYVDLRGWREFKPIVSDALTCPTASDGRQVVTDIRTAG